LIGPVALHFEQREGDRREPA